ncbi:MAG: hypothetical protein K2P63_03115 [Lachnospiraceae bacterium]|nr:hypothetical protein [Lachnospiraceae bacterium]
MEGLILCRMGAWLETAEKVMSARRFFSSFGGFGLCVTSFPMKKRAGYFYRKMALCDAEVI